MQTLVTLTEAHARAAMDAMLKEAAARKKAVSLAICDSHGETIGQWRMDHASLPSIIIAANKAFTAARLTRPSRAIGEFLKTSGDIAFFGDARYVGFAGGLPVTHDGKTLGALGVSGLTQDEDEELAQIGVAAITALFAPPK